MILLDATQLKTKGLFYKWQKAKIACYRMLLWVIRNIKMIGEFSIFLLCKLKYASTLQDKRLMKRTSMSYSQLATQVEYHSSIGQCSLKGRVSRNNSFHCTLMLILTQTTQRGVAMNWSAICNTVIIVHRHSLF